MADTPDGKKEKKPFPFDKALESILTIKQVKKAKLEATDNGDLDSIRVISDGSLMDKTVSDKIESVLLLDLNYKVNHKVIKVVSRKKDPEWANDTGEARE